MSRSCIAARQNAATRSVMLAGLGGLDERDLCDRGVDEEVDDRVAVVGGGELALHADPVDGLAALGEAVDHLVGRERVEHALDALGRLELVEARVGQVAARDVVEQVLEPQHHAGAPSARRRPCRAARASTVADHMGP
jgi:hypothetical protein